VSATFFERVAALQREGQVFAVATVVSRRAPVSAHLGDRAIVFADGRFEGFVGGACSRDIIRQQALAALEARCARLVSIQPDATGSGSTEHVIVAMTCASEGAVDVYVEPFMPARRFVVVGATPVAEAVARLARSMDYEVVRVVEAGEQRDIQGGAELLDVKVVPLESLATILQEERSDLAVVVASQGHYDEPALESILECGAPYVGLVASRTRAAAIRSQLEAGGVKNVETIRNPAGLDLGARTPPEVALSILAEVVQLHPHRAPAEKAAPPPAAVDPVCGMQVDPATARHTAEVEGRAYYFCCPHCRTAFLRDPQQYLVSASS
jgi:xanthine dehydrogenase accessory factor